MQPSARLSCAARNRLTRHAGGATLIATTALGRMGMTYHLEGRLLEVCDCRVLCPCWIGEDPDNGTCDSVMAYHFDKGTIEGVDVAGRTIAFVCHIPGNVLNGNFRVAVYLDQ